MPFIELAALAEMQRVPGFHGRFIHTENVTFSYWRIEKNALLPSHRHPHEQITVVIEGKLELTVDGETRILERRDNGSGPPTVSVIPPNGEHGGKALTGCVVIDVFYPVREDYRSVAR